VLNTLPTVIFLIFRQPNFFLIFSYLESFQLFKLSYFSTISYLDSWEKINNLFIDEKPERIILSQLFIFVKRQTKVGSV
jgi:hypothetical protein